MLHVAEQPTLDASLITVNYHTLDRVRRLLDGIHAARPTCSHEFVFVENGSTDPSRALIEEHFPWVRYRYAENRGFAAGTNRGVEWARGRYVFLLNPDTEIPPRLIDRWVEWMDQHPEVAISGPALQYPTGEPQPSAFRYHRLLTPLARRTRLAKTAWGKAHLVYFEQPFLRQTETYAEVEWLLGAALCVRREVMHQLNGIDERYFLYFEDEDFCRRARARGYRIAFVPSLTVTHAYGKLSHLHTWTDVFRKRAFREHVKSAILYFWRYLV
jgi:GT2 family glycosyltransferase